MESRGPGRQQAIARHRHEDSRLAELEDEQDGRHGSDRTECEHTGCPVGVDVLQRDRERVGHVELVPRNDPRQHQRDRDVQDGTNDQRPDDARGNVALGIPRFLGSRTDGVEPDVRKEDDCRADADARQAVGRERGRRPLLRLHIGHAHDQEQADDRHLDDNH